MRTTGIDRILFSRLLSIAVIAALGMAAPVLHAQDASPAPAASPSDTPTAAPAVTPATDAAGQDVEAVYQSLPGYGSKAQVRVITDNPEAWYARWYMLEHAQKTIDSTYFIVDPDIFGRSFLGMLLKKSKEGVKIRLMVDARGTKMIARRFFDQDLVQELVNRPNVEVKVYNPLYKAILDIPREYRSAISSNHSKLLIVDGEWVITGGRNIAEHYFADVKDDPEVYRDTDILMRGTDLGTQATKAFDEEFDKLINYQVEPSILHRFISHETALELARRAMQAHMMGMDAIPTDGTSLGDQLASLQDELKPLDRIRSYASYDPFHGERVYPTLILDKHAVVMCERNDITDNICRLIEACKSEVIIENPYVVLTPKARAALIAAGKKGVDIEILTNSPESTDSLLTQVMFMKEWKSDLKDIPNLHIFAIDEHRKLHAKVFVFDRKVACIGTYNMDYMSEQINGEEMAVVDAPAFATRNWHRIQDDKAMTVEYKIKVAQDGSVTQVVGPSDHCSRFAMMLLNVMGVLTFLRPII